MEQDYLMEKKSRIYIAGHRGLVGGAVFRKLTSEGYENIVTKTKTELNLINQDNVRLFLKKQQPEYVFLCAAKVGGILANSTYPAQFIYENLSIQNNLIHSCHEYGVKKLLFMGSSCIYPRLTVQPIREECLLSGPLEKTNEAYAIAKIAGIIMCQSYNRQYGTNFISAMPTNLYGPGDMFDPENSHVVPALILKFHRAKKNNEKSVEVWGTGNPRREFLYVDDLAEALVFLMANYDSPEIINVGTGEDVSIKELALMIKDVVGYEGNIRFDPSKPDGTPRKLLDVTKINSLGWHAKTNLREGLTATYRWYLQNHEGK